jgi:hypothetical protein
MFDLFWDFNKLSKVEHKMKWRSWDISAFLGILGFWAYVTCMGCWPMGLPILRPILYV